MFDTKVAPIVRFDLQLWQKLNVAAFLATGVAAVVPEALGEPYVDRSGRVYGRMLGQPMLVFAADRAGLQAAPGETLARGLAVRPLLVAMFSTGPTPPSGRPSRPVQIEDSFVVVVADDQSLLAIQVPEHGSHPGRRSVSEVTEVPDLIPP